MTVREPTPPDYYRELEVVPAAAAETIRAAYTALAKRHHPDLNPSRAAAERMQRLNDAYAVLGNETRRRAYDAVRAQQPEAAPASFGLFVAGVPVARSNRPPSPRRARSRRIALYAACTGGAIVLLLLVLLVRGLSDEHAKAATVPTPASNIVLRQVSSGATPTPISLRGADLIAAAASYPGFPEIDGLRDASHGVTAADKGWTFQLLGCTVLVGQYNDPDRARVAIVYWRDGIHADAAAAGTLVAGVSGCPDSSSRDTVLAGLRAILNGAAGVTAP